MKRFFLVLGVVLALVALVVAIFLLFFRPQEPEVPGTVTENPFGDAGAGIAIPPNAVTPEIGVPIQGAGEEVAPQLFKITDGPVAHGAVAFHVRTGDTGSSTEARPVVDDTEVRYVERASGNIYRYQVDARALERITNLTLPGIQEALWASDGSRVFMRFISQNRPGQMETYSLPANGGEGYVLEPGLSDLVVVGTSSILSVLPSSNGSVGTRATLAGAGAGTAFTSPLRNLRVFASGTGYAAVTKPSALLPGYAFSISKTSGEFTRLAGPLSGLTLSPSPSGAFHLIGYRNGGTLRLALLEMATGEQTLLPISTIADKCVWSKDSTTIYCAVPRTITGTFPDDWYLGAVQTSDRIWKIDLETRIATLVVDPSLLADTDIDAVSLALDDENDVLVFTNRDDGSLWLYDF